MDPATGSSSSSAAPVSTTAAAAAAVPATKEQLVKEVRKVAAAVRQAAKYVDTFAKDLKAQEEGDADNFVEPMTDENAVEKIVSLASPFASQTHLIFRSLGGLSKLVSTLDPEAATQIADPTSIDAPKLLRDATYQAEYQKGKNALLEQEIKMLQGEIQRLRQQQPAPGTLAVSSYSSHGAAAATPPQKKIKLLSPSSSSGSAAARGKGDARDRMTPEYITDEDDAGSDADPTYEDDDEGDRIAVSDFGGKKKRKRASKGKTTSGAVTDGTGMGNVGTLFRHSFINPAYGITSVLAKKDGGDLTPTNREILATKIVLHMARCLGAGLLDAARCEGLTKFPTKGVNTDQIRARFLDNVLVFQEDRRRVWNAAIVAFNTLPPKFPAWWSENFVIIFTTLFAYVYGIPVSVGDQHLDKKVAGTYKDNGHPWKALYAGATDEGVRPEDIPTALSFFTLQNYPIQTYLKMVQDYTNYAVNEEDPLEVDMYAINYSETGPKKNQSSQPFVKPKTPNKKDEFMTQVPKVAKVVRITEGLATATVDKASSPLKTEVVLENGTVTPPTGFKRSELARPYYDLERLEAACTKFWNKVLRECNGAGDFLAVFELPCNMEIVRDELEVDWEMLHLFSDPPKISPPSKKRKGGEEEGEENGDESPEDDIPLQKKGTRSVTFSDTVPAAATTHADSAPVVMMSLPLTADAEREIEGSGDSDKPMPDATSAAAAAAAAAAAVATTAATNGKHKKRDEEEEEEAVDYEEGMDTTVNDEKGADSEAEESEAEDNSSSATTASARTRGTKKTKSPTSAASTPSTSGRKSSRSPRGSTSTTTPTEAPPPATAVPILTVTAVTAVKPAAATTTTAAATKSTPSPFGNKNKFAKGSGAKTTGAK